MEQLGTDVKNIKVSTAQAIIIQRTTSLRGKFGDHFRSYKEPALSVNMEK